MVADWTCMTLWRVTFKLNLGGFRDWTYLYAIRIGLVVFKISCLGSSPASKRVSSSVIAGWTSTALNASTAIFPRSTSSFLTAIRGTPISSSAELRIFSYCSSTLNWPSISCVNWIETPSPSTLVWFLNEGAEIFNKFTSLGSVSSNCEILPDLTSIWTLVVPRIVTSPKDIRELISESNFAFSCLGNSDCTTSKGFASTYLNICLTVCLKLSLSSAGIWFSPTRLSFFSVTGLNVCSLVARRTINPFCLLTLFNDNNGISKASFFFSFSVNDRS